MELDQIVKSIHYQMNNQLGYMDGIIARRQAGVSKMGDFDELREHHDELCNLSKKVHETETQLTQTQAKLDGIVADLEEICQPDIEQGDLIGIIKKYKQHSSDEGDKTEE